ncbi:DUF4440 domain-containing protein [Streptomyces sp. HMX112]|uniref:nuclear transport factor 2 family protein n=1 Tax=Streptomyces sp. HMX112 TaxID=3390850 RepID=UPI003A7FFAFD
MTDPTADPAVAAAIEGELRLLDPAVRAEPELFGALLHPDFHEFGTSGRHWDRASLISAVTAKEAAPPRPPHVSHMRGVRLSHAVVHLTFDTDADGRASHRSSLWVRAGSGWLLYFHQGTPFRQSPPGA